jgi:hypothetical protein
MAAVSLSNRRFLLPAIHHANIASGHQSNYYSCNGGEWHLRDWHRQKRKRCKSIPRSTWRSTAARSVGTHPIAHVDGRSESAWLGRVRCRFCNRRCVHRSSKFRDVDPWSRLRSCWVSCWNRQSTRLAIVRSVETVWQAEAVLWDQRWQHGQHDQSLHRQQKGPQRRRLFAWRKDWLTARSSDARLLPTCA